MLGGIGGAAVTDPSAMVKIDSRENPMLYFMMSRSSPLLSLGKEIVTGRDFFGNRLDRPSDYLGIFAEKVTPVMLQNLLIQEPRGEWKALFGEFAGMRTWPRGEWEKRDELRAQYLEGTGKNWEDLPRAEQKELERAHPDLQEITEKIKRDFDMQRGSDYQKAERLVKDFIDEQFRTVMENLAQAKVAGQINWDKYNDLRDDYLTEKSSGKTTLWAMKSILEKESVDDIKRWIEKNQKPEDKAMDEYKAILREPVLGEDNLPDWGMTYAKADAYLKRQEPEIADYIKLHQHDWIKDLPPTARQVEAERLEIIN
jgi:hypothetical protein